jgi:hypothetical protein
MKISKPFHWVLAALASLIVFSIAYYQAVLGNNSLAAFCLVFAIIAGVMISPLEILTGRRFIVSIAALFLLTCLFPPWQYIHGGAAGYGLVFDPPKREDSVQIDSGRLLIEWAAVAGSTGLIWILKPTWLRRDVNES